MLTIALSEVTVELLLLPWITAPVLDYLSVRDWEQQCNHVFLSNIVKQEDQCLHNKSEE
jgi:hypothetical protein